MPDEGRSRWRPLWTVLAALVLLVVAAVAGWALFVRSTQPDEPGDFYSAPTPLPDGPPGTLLRNEVIDGFRQGATAYRVLYKSTGYDGSPIAVSGFVVVPDGDPPPEGRRVVAYTHGTVGVASRCAPSLVTKQEEQPLFAEGGDDLLEAGYVVVASDYQGLGTRGPHPYLVGDAEGMNALDSVRAARNLAEASAGDEFAVWGHSQGGHASLFTGQLASSYAPELNLVGVAAGGPVPNLKDLFAVNVETTVGRVLIAMALSSWTRVYEEASLDDIVTPLARPLVRRIARNCLYNQNQILASLPAALALDLTFLRAPPWGTEPWETIIETNTPGGARTNVPILLVQGDADPIVTLDVTERLADRLCAAGETVDLRLLPGVGHLQTGTVAAPDVVAWISDRFAGKPTATSCG